MVLLVAGALVVALGLFSGIVLTLAPLGLAPWSPELVLWVLFPLFSGQRPIPRGSGVIWMRRDPLSTKRRSTRVRSRPGWCPTA